MSNQTRFNLSVVVAILLVTNSIIAFNYNQPLKWLWLIVAFFSAFNLFYFYKRKQNQSN